MTSEDGQDWWDIVYNVDHTSSARSVSMGIRYGIHDLNSESHSGAKLYRLRAKDAIVDTGVWRYCDQGCDVSVDNVTGDRAGIDPGNPDLP